MARGPSSGTRHPYTGVFVLSAHPFYGCRRRCKMFLTFLGEIECSLLSGDCSKSGGFALAASERRLDRGLYGGF